MDRNASVILYGHDPSLLLYRSMVLKTVFDTVTVALSKEFVSWMLDTRHIDLLILCQTLTQEECDALLTSAKTRWPRSKVLVLEASFSARTHDAEVAHANPLDGPVNLLRRIEQLLASPKNPDRPRPNPRPNPGLQRPTSG